MDRQLTEIDMRTIHHQLFRYCTIAACAAIVANGCMLPRRATLEYNPNTLEPGQFCPGDTLRASFDYLGSDICQDWDTITCASRRPNIRITSTPESFPPATINDFAGRVDFAPAADRVDVTFEDTDGDNLVSFPSTRPDGTRYAIHRSSSTRTLTAARITGTVETTLTHAGMCAGSTPMHAAASLASPSSSPNLRVREVCNVNSVPVSVTLSGGAPGITFNQTLAPGACFTTSMPGVPSGIETSTNVEIRSMTVDPAVRCGVATQADNPPAPLRTIVRRSCG
jgi:hypothetical protein